MSTCVRSSRQGRTVMCPCPDCSVQLTVTATTLDWVNEPDVPVTVKLTALDAGVVGLLFELLPHPMENIETSSSSPNVVVHTILVRVRGFRLRVVKTVPNRPSPGSRAMPSTP